MQIRIEFLGNRVDRLQSIFSQEIIELLENQTHARIDGRVFAFAAGGGKAKLKIIDNRDESLEQRTVGVLDRFFFFARATASRSRALDTMRRFSTSALRKRSRL